MTPTETALMIATMVGAAILVLVMMARGGGEG